MKAFEFVRTDTGAVVGHGCGACGLLWTDKMFGGAEGAGREQAERCCLPPKCSTCGEEYKGWCKACSARKSAEEERAAFERATKMDLANYDGDLLYFDGCSIGRDGYVDTECVLDELDDYEGERPTYAWACAPEGVSWDLADRLADHVCSEHHEDAFERVDTEKLKEAQRLVDEACKDVVSYYPDHSRAVLIPASPKEIEASPDEESSS